MLGGVLREVLAENTILETERSQQCRRKPTRSSDDIVLWYGLEAGHEKSLYRTNYINDLHWI